MNKQLIGAEILSLAEVDVAPEDLVFHKFYANKMSSTKKQKKKKKKKRVEEEDAEELLAGVGDDGESDNEEIENMLDSANPSLQADGDYDYDDLDNIANEDDDDLIGNVSDQEIDLPSDIVDRDIEDADVNSADIDDDEVAIGEADDGSDEEDSSDRRQGKQKRRRNAAVSPFASLEDYEHLMNEANPAADKWAKARKSKPKRKRKTSE